MAKQSTKKRVLPPEGTYAAPRNHVEDIHVSSVEVICDGGNGALGHPRVYLHIDRAVGSVTCGYCSRHYILDGDGHH